MISCQAFLCYNFNGLKPFMANIALYFIAICLLAQPYNCSPKYQYSAANDASRSFALEHYQESSANTETSKDSPPYWYTPHKRPDWWVVIIAGLTGLAIAIQAREMRKATTVMQGQLSQMRDSSERQLRAYVISESSTIFNVSNPVPIFPGQVFKPTGAEITNPACGPGVRIQIKNAGQTPAYDVAHWGNICFREFPLKSHLPARDPNFMPVKSVLGPGIPSTKLLFMPQALTAKEVADLRAGNAAVYVYGEISYRDTFGKDWYTKYRVMHHPLGGAIGVSTDLTFCDEGNEAN
jgi:hypothetical protein